MTDIKPKGKHAIFYPDGGCRPNPGPYGTGVHGYVFSDVSEKPEILANHFMTFKNVKTAGNEPVPKAVPTDKGYITCDKEGRVDSRYHWVKPDFYVDICASDDNIRGTNNIGELRGFLLSFQEALTIEGLETLVLCPDSQYAIDALTYVEGWKERGWLTRNGTPVVNRELIESIVEARDALLAKGVKIDFNKVKGHTDDMGNNTADFLASTAVNRSTWGDIRVQTIWSIGRKYWEYKVDRHPMLHGRRFIFSRKAELHNPSEIFMIEPAGTDLTIGKRDHEGYALIKLKNPCPAMEVLQEAQSRYNQHENWPINVRTDRLYDKFVQQFMMRFGSHTLGPSPLTRGKTDVGMTFLDGGLVAGEHNPPALIYRVIEAASMMKERLEEYLEKSDNHMDVLDFPTEYHGIIARDITYEFFHDIEKKHNKVTITKKELKPSIVVGYQKHMLELDLVVDGETSKQTIPLTLGMDLPTRNVLKKLEDEEPRVTLISWRNAPGRSFQYACIVECTSGVGIWSNYFCNRFFV